MNWTHDARFLPPRFSIIRASGCAEGQLLVCSLRRSSRRNHDFRRLPGNYKVLLPRGTPRTWPSGFLHDT